MMRIMMLLLIIIIINFKMVMNDDNDDFLRSFLCFTSIYTFSSNFHPFDAYLISTAKRRLDNIYYALIEQASQKKDDKNNSSSNSNNDRNYIDSTIASSSSSTANSINRNIIPRIVLDALIEAAGQLGMTDRAFATFQEYRTLFHRIPDIHTYNSLLTGVSFCR